MRFTGGTLIDGVGGAIKLSLKLQNLYQGIPPVGIPTLLHCRGQNADLQHAVFLGAFQALQQVARRIALLELLSDCASPEAPRAWIVALAGVCR